MKTNKNRGKLFLVPTPLIEGQNDALPEANKIIIQKCRHFLVESFKMGRRHVKAMAPDFNFAQATFDELNKETDPIHWEELVAPVMVGHDICILSDAGSPVIADPGSNIVKMAHRKGIEVVPLSGPSSIMLALMASGLSGQQFTFHGYLKRDKNSLRNDLRRLEQDIRSGYTQIFMETPYRNLTIFDLAMNSLHDSTLFCIACDLTASNSFVRTKDIGQWKRENKPDIQKRPCIFLLGK